MATMGTVPIYTSESIPGAATWVCDRTRRPKTDLSKIQGAVDELRLAGR